MERLPGGRLLTDERPSCVSHTRLPRPRCQQRELETRLQVESMADLLPRERRPNKKQLAMKRQEERVLYEAERYYAALDSEGASSSSSSRSSARYDAGGAAARARQNAAERVRRRRVGVEDLVVVRVVDRTALVLEIFARRATTRSGRLQVALALATYKTPRLTSMLRPGQQKGANFSTFKAHILSLIHI